MKQGMTFDELVGEVTLQAKTAQDFKANTSALNFGTTDGATSMEIVGHGQFTVGTLPHRQIAEYLGIPMPYYKRIQVEHPEVLDFTLNHLMHERGNGNGPDRRLVRTVERFATEVDELGNQHTEMVPYTRAFLSTRYRPLDCFDLLEAVVPILVQCGLGKDSGLRLESCSLTESNMYLKLVSPRVHGQIPGMPAQAGVVIWNSDVGDKSLAVKPLVYISTCRNGAIVEDASFLTRHIGKYTGGEDGDASIFYRDETRQADDQAFWMKVQDVVRGVLSDDALQSKFEIILQKFAAAHELKIEGNPEKAVEVVANKFSLTDGQRGQVLRHLIDGGDLSALGVSNALTRTSQDLDNYEEATRFEILGGRVIDLPRQDWTTIATAR